MNNAVLGHDPRILKTNEAAQVEWAELYMRLCPVAGIRTVIAYAQAVHETNYFRFTGQANASWNNPAGLGVSGAIDPDTGAYIGNRFSTKEAGVRAHLGHLLWYFGHYHPEAGFCATDQRHFGWLGGHKHLENDIRQLNGRWAVPGGNYGERIATIAYEMEQP
ncbi:MAG: glucosaminidase domain-containing protein [Actinobacteria bacterium]|nr:glucosaminidase domain-containing protein [Actinomycetota bacterium]